MSHHLTPLLLVPAAFAMCLCANPAPVYADDPGLASLKGGYVRPLERKPENPALVALGRKLFWDTRVSASGKTACVSCPLPSLAWGAMEAKSRNDSGKLTSRKSPGLIGIGHLASGAPNGWDGRNATLEAQIKSSIVGGSMSMKETATPVRVEVIERRIAAIPEYAARFEKALPRQPIDVDAIATAIAAYERTFEPGRSAFDRWVAGEETAISDEAKHGFALFNGKAGCAACHSGWRLTDDNFHDIGTSRTDRGRGRELTSDPAMQFAFKTPTLRSIALHPPYMHDGSFATLEDVIRHYETGGIERASRSPLLSPISISDEERSDLVEFLQTLTGEPEGDTAPALPAE